MREKQTILLIGLTALILILTGAGIRNTSSNSIMGIVALIIIPGLMTWYLLVILAYARKIMDILAAFLIPGPRKEGHRSSLLVTILAWVIVILVAGILVRPELARALAGTLKQAAEVFASTISAFRQPNQPENPSNPSMSTSNLILYYYTAIIFGAIILVSLSLFLGAFHKAFKEIRAEIGGKEGNEELRQEVLGVVQGARTKLEGRERYHETILDCYRQMCNLLSGKGYNIRPAQTAREFALNLSGNLNLDAESVNGLTFLFEEARYSKHEMGDDQRGMALNYLNSLERILLSVGVEK